MIARVVKIALWICLLFVSVDAIGRDTLHIPPNIDLKLRVDTLKIDSGARDAFFQQLLQQAEKRAARKRRNIFELNASLHLAHTQFENWASGGDNTFSGRTRFFLKYLYTREKFTFETKLETKYGVTYIDGKSYKNEDEFKINFISSWGMSRNWSYSAAVSLRSQFTTGYKSRDDRTRKSTFMAPGYLDLSFGIKYSKSPIFSLTISPVSGNVVLMLDDELSAQGLNGVAKGRYAHWSVGPSTRLLLDVEFAKSVFRLRSDLFSFCNPRKPPTVRWETVLDIRATKFLTTTIAALVNYDKDADTPRYNTLQYKYSFSVGLSYTFKSK